MNKLAILGGEKIISPEKGRFIWPKITPYLEEVILTQARESLSIYNKSGILLGTEIPRPQLVGKSYTSGRSLLELRHY